MRLSLVVGLYNMGREVPRTLHTMSPAYQGVSAQEYEIVLVDNGSANRLNEAELQAIAPNVRYVYVEDAAPSPTEAINQAVAQSTGDLVTIVIDGARMFSPGVLSRTLQAASLYEEPYVYAPSLHLGSQLQNDLAFGGYDQQIEDDLLASVRWRDDGYELFSISNVAAVSERLMLPTFESNCFTVRRSTWNRLGGYHSGFAQSTGGGLANWELFSRYLSDQAISPVLLIGEATFHQFHGGASTNQPRANHPVRTWLAEHQQIFGKPYAWPVYQPVLFGEPRPQVTESLYQRNFHAHVALLRELGDQNEHDAAVAIGRLLVERFPNDPAKHQILAESLDRASRRAEALEAIDAALAIAPTQAELHVTRGIVHVGRGAFDQARASYDRALELDDILSEAYFHRAHLCLRQADGDGAIADFERAIASAPNPPPHYLEDLARARAEQSEGVPEPAVESVTEPSDTSLHDAFMQSVQRRYGAQLDDAEIAEHALHGSFSVADSRALREIVRTANPTRILVIGGFLGLSTGVLTDATEAISSTVVTVDPNLRHRVFDAPLDHARSFVTSDRVQFIDGFFGARTDGGVRFDLAERDPKLEPAAIDEAIANVAIVQPPGAFDLVLIDGDFGSAFELTAHVLAALAPGATLVLPGLYHEQLAQLLSFGSRTAMERVEVDEGAGFFVVRRSDGV